MDFSLEAVAWTHVLEPGVNVASEFIQVTEECVNLHSGFTMLWYFTKEKKSMSCRCRTLELDRTTLLHLDKMNMKLEVFGS